MRRIVGCGICVLFAVTIGACYPTTGGSGGGGEASDAADQGTEVADGAGSAEVGASCTSDSDCAEGVCAEESGTCVGCLEDADCSGDALCDKVNQRCAGTCEEGSDCTNEDRPYCSGDGVCAECVFDRHCPSDDCDRSTSPPSCACRTTGESCGADVECCTLNCDGGTCAEAESCAELGESCSSSSGCCGSAFCNEAGECEECGAAGASCSTDSDCCEGTACNDDDVCETCVAEGESCADQPCCTGDCVGIGSPGNPDTEPTCSTADCSTKGGSCETTSDCCDGLRCHSDGVCRDCLESGEPCLDSELSCCSEMCSGTRNPDGGTSSSCR